jgi:hypothetical protein
MTDLASNIHVVLQDAGFETWSARAGDLPGVGFKTRR